ncbi:cellulose binding domain-containing protein [Oceanirhabdus sp. W0125-5]|uniref:cellulose binding domain-containing protein n=1 Tax=Oceanirhabdus sp. W0125-5 TaxID=2999116 RepID=UPI0022F2F8DD|nr:cellulose binding domain-containing protein [Oceanirhabdus sp. W0125-5]WBW99067.1 cellulose binding domain-containing protein [Oceanirhabdus sp. W0125-5]
MYSVKYIKLNEETDYFKGRIIIENNTFNELKDWKVKFKFINGQKIVKVNYCTWKQEENEVLLEPKYNWYMGPFQKIALDFVAQYKIINEDPTDFEVISNDLKGETGNILVNLEQPMFCDHNFQPIIYLNGATVPMDWGTSHLFSNLEANKSYEIDAKTFKKEKKSFIPIIQPSSIVVKENETKECNIKYYEKCEEYKLHFEVVYKVTSSWNTGFNADIEIINKGEEEISPWELSFHFPGNQRITSLWNGKFTQVDNKVTVLPASWNSSIPVGMAVKIGFGATYSGKNEDPKDFTLNGQGPEVKYGSIEVTVEKPEFSSEIFIPQVTIGDNTKNVYWGKSVVFEELVAGKSFDIIANYHRTETKMYMPEAYPSKIIVEEDIVKTSVVKYTEKDIPPSPKNKFVGYFQSWSDRWSSTGKGTDLGNLPSYVNVVILAFAKPDMIYNGDLNFRTTGLEFSYEGVVLKEAIDYLKERNPETKVLLSVGGATYTNWGNLNVDDIVRFVQDFDLDGVDIDYEPLTGFGCKPDSNGIIHCTSDNQYVSIIERLRTRLPRPYILAATPWSVGAYGEGKWKDAEPKNLTTTGMMLQVIKRAGDKLDLINVMGYNAGELYDPIESVEAYKYYFQGDVAMGAMVPPEDWGTHVWTLNEIDRVAQYIYTTSAGGMMLWSLQRSTVNPSPEFPDNLMMAREIAKELGFPNYDDPLFPLGDSKKGQ